MLDREEQIREDNDVFRRTCAGCPHIAWYGSPFFAPRQIAVSVLQLIETYTDFVEDAVFHDFGSVTVEGITYSWDITYHSESGGIVDPMQETVAYRGIYITPEC
jgi:hypothetical protein